MESILNSSARVAPSRPQPTTQGMRASIILVIVGLAASALGGLMFAAAGGEPQGSGNEPAVLALGLALLGCGLLMFLAGLLIEFFEIGNSLWSIARSSEATLSLLRSRPPSPGSESGIRNSEFSQDPPRVAS